MTTWAVFLIFPQNNDVWGRPASELKLTSVTSLSPPADHRDTLHTPEAQCLCINILYLGQTSALMWRTRKSTGKHSAGGMCNNVRHIGPLSFLALGPWRRNWGLMQDYWMTNAQTFLCSLLVRNSIFMYLMMHNAEPGTDTKWVQVPGWGLEWCIHGAFCFYCCVFPLYSISQ